MSTINVPTATYWQDKREEWVLSHIFGNFTYDYEVGDFPGKSTAVPTDNTSWYPPSKPMGWECPKCGKVYSPNTKECFDCNLENEIERLGDDQS